MNKDNYSLKDIENIINETIDDIVSSENITNSSYGHIGMLLTRLHTLNCFLTKLLNYYKGDDDNNEIYTKEYFQNKTAIRLNKETNKLMKLSKKIFNNGLKDTEEIIWR